MNTAAMHNICGTITESGCLCIYPLTPIASYALRKWVEDNQELVNGPEGKGNSHLLVSTAVRDGGE